MNRVEKKVQDHGAALRPLEAVLPAAPILTAATVGIFVIAACGQITGQDYQQVCFGGALGLVDDDAMRLTVADEAPSMGALLGDRLARLAA